MELNEAKEILKNAGYIVEDTETNDEEMDELRSKWFKKSGSTVNDPLFKKMTKVYDKRMNLDNKISLAKNYNYRFNSWTEDDIQEIRDAIYERFDPDFGGFKYWSVETGNNGKNYIYYKGEEVCIVAYNKKEKSVNLNFGDSTGTDFEFDPKEESFEEFIKNIVYTINDQKPSK